jgi:exonuclease SbcC
MILLKKIILNNFLSHEKTEIEFKEDEKVLLDGQSGAGKSSIFDAIIWVLYGQGRSENRSLVKKGAKKGSVYLELIRRQENREDVVIITRSTTSTGKHSIEVAIQQDNNPRIALPLSGVREIQNWIDKELIGASYLLFINSVAYVQGNSESFVVQTAPKRKELLLEIVKAEDHDKYYEQARDCLSVLDNDSNRLSGQVIELEARLEAIRPILGALESHYTKIEDHANALGELEPKIELLEEKKTSLLALCQTVDILEKTIRSAKADKEILESSISRKKAEIVLKPTLIAILNTAPLFKEDIEKTNKKLIELRNTLSIASEQEEKRNEVLRRKPVINDYHFTEIEHLNKKITVIKSEPVCPSGVDCPYSGDHIKQIEELETQIKNNENAIKEEADSLLVWETEFNKLPLQLDLRSILKETKETETYLKQLESELAKTVLVQKDIDTITILEKEIPDLEKSLEEKNEFIKENVEKMDSIEIGATQINAVEAELLIQKENQRTLNENISKEKMAIEILEQNERESKIIEEKITYIKEKELKDIQEKKRKVELIKSAFSHNGIETLVIDILIPRLEDKINEILTKFSDFRIHLDTQKKSVDMEKDIEGLWITIINDCGEEMPLENLSGGEHAKISVAITESLATLQKCGFRLYDEFITALDENSLEGFIVAIEYLQKQYSQMLVISHIRDIKDMFDKQLRCTKINGISKIG